MEPIWEMGSSGFATARTRRMVAGPRWNSLLRQSLGVLPNLLPKPAWELALHSWVRTLVYATRRLRRLQGALADPQRRPCLRSMGEEDDAGGSARSGREK